MSKSHDGRLLSFDVGDEERLIVGAISQNGSRRTIYEGAEPDEYALVPTRELVGEQNGVGEKVNAKELRPEDLRVLGKSTFVGPEDDTEVSMSVDDEKRIEQGAPGVYGLLWIPLAEL